MSVTNPPGVNDVNMYREVTDQPPHGNKPKALRKASNFSLGRALVNKSTTLSCVGTYAKSISPACSHSLTC